ncbi:MAG: RsmE family RNA methyltransferase [Candidatus Omnitrophica bacterium]|nr:RsmE family RNA methyltransferase [Candidatus Omnitrophota bacterium]
MHRLYCPAKNISGINITLDDKEQVHHAKNVLRIKIGEEVIIFDDKGSEYRSVLGELLPESIIFRIKEKSNSFVNHPEAKVTIACAIPKASHMDEIVDKLTQLGVGAIIPMETERVIVKLDKRKKMLRQARWKKIILNASQQSQRNTLPVLEPIMNIEEVLLKSSNYDLKLIPTLTGQRQALKGILAKNNAKNILVLIGPEGDFTDEEVNLAKKSGFLPVSLGHLVLRVETAAVSVASFIRLYHENS